MTPFAERCTDTTLAPRGWLRCLRPLGHDGLHQIDPAGPWLTRAEAIPLWLTPPHTTALKPGGNR